MVKQHKNFKIVNHEDNNNIITNVSEVTTTVTQSSIGIQGTIKFHRIASQDNLPVKSIHLVEYFWYSGLYIEYNIFKYRGTLI